MTDRLQELLEGAAIGIGEADSPVSENVYHAVEIIFVDREKAQALFEFLAGIEAKPPETEEQRAFRRYAQTCAEIGD